MHDRQSLDFFACEQSSRSPINDFVGDFQPLVKNIAFLIKFCVAKAGRCLTMNRQPGASQGLTKISVTIGTFSPSVTRD